MAHAGFATGEPKGFKHAHLRPAQAEAIADGIVNFTGGRDAVLDQPQGFPPHGFQQAVGDECVYLLANMQGLHAQITVDRLRSLNDAGIGLSTAHQFHQWQQVDRVKGMGDEETLGVRKFRLQFGGQDAGRGGGDDRPGVGAGFDFGVNGFFQLRVFRYGLDNQFGVGGRFRGRRGK